MKARSRIYVPIALLVGATALAACASQHGSIPLADGTVQSSGSASVRPAAAGRLIGSGFLDPQGVAYSNGFVYVADSGHNAVKGVFPPFTGPKHGTINTEIKKLQNPSDIVLDGGGDLYVADTDASKIMLKDTEGTPLHAIGSGFNRPVSLALDAKLNVYVADSGNNAIKKITPKGKTSTLASTPDPEGIAVDKHGTVYFTNHTNGTVDAIKGGTVSTIASGFVFPWGVAVDAHDNVYVADNSAGKIDEIAPNGTVTTVVSGLNQPEGISLDPHGNVYVACFTETSVLRFKL